MRDLFSSANQLRSEQIHTYSNNKVFNIIKINEGSVRHQMNEGAK
jgi:hypothetical protein